ncbi:MAG TPA: GYF domain-containing protein, partial [Kofleriaceae bacterium]
MKFLCDRCKTRYSIGDERVRGKILKIRCKHCSNVITVREGMQVDDGSVVAALPGMPRTKTSTIAPEALDERNASSGLLNVASLSPAPGITAAKRSAVAADTALSGAMASASAPAALKPPPALEEEWYVSIDGDQSGPFSLAEAQRWVAARPFEADLHCWSEGFDDWLPVDKVSHFRGLRKKPAPPPAPPVMHAMPRTITPRPPVSSAGPATRPLRPAASSAGPATTPLRPAAAHELPQPGRPAAATPASEQPGQARAAAAAHELPQPGRPAAATPASEQPGRHAAATPASEQPGRHAGPFAAAATSELPQPARHASPFAAAPPGASGAARSP